MKKSDFVKKSPTGFEPGTPRLQILCLTPRLRVMIQRDGGRFNINQVLKSTNSFEKRRIQINIKRLKAPSNYLTCNIHVIYPAILRNKLTILSIVQPAKAFNAME